MPDDTTAGESSVSRVRSYYRALDTDDYECLTDLLAPEFVHERPDMTLEGRTTFVTFMRDERPVQETTHPLDSIYRQNGGQEIVARGRLLDPDGELITRFVDVFSFETNRIAQIRTFTD